MTDLAVLGQDPRFGGGALAQMEAFLAAARELGRRPELVYAPHPTLAGDRVTLDRVEALRQRRWASRLAPRLEHAQSVWVVTTMATHGLAAPLSRRRYGCWLGTSLDDEWAARARGLDPLRRLAQRLNAPALRPLERRVIREAVRVYATSPSSRAAVARAGGIPEGGIGILPLPVDVEQLRPEPDEQWLERLQAPVIAFVGRADDPRKNLPLLIGAFDLIRARAPEVRLRLIGRPPARVSAGVEVLGEVGSLWEPLRSASLLVLPSWQEGFGIVVAEALACGVPVLSTPCGGPEELLRASGGGRVLSGFDPEELAASALELLRDAASLATMRRSGRDYVVREHSPERLRELLRPALEEVDGHA